MKATTTYIMLRRQWQGSRRKRKGWWAPAPAPRPAIRHPTAACGQVILSHHIGSNVQVFDKAIANLDTLYRNDIGQYGLRCASVRKMSLERWSKLLLTQQGGRFARHPIFAFLVFNMTVRLCNGRVSLSTISRKSFHKFKWAVDNLTPESLRMAEEQLEGSGKSGNEDIDTVLRELEVFGL